MEADDDALRVTASVAIPTHELDWRFGPSGGPGGQHANRAHTRAEVRFDVRRSSSLSDAQLSEFDAVFAPGGHGPMVDLADNPDVGRLLTALQARRAPIAALCHGPAILLSAPERADGLWLFDGYRMTSFTDEEEDQTEAGRLGMEWLLDVALKNAGAVFDDGPSAWISHVVVDRNLITGQNPGSTEATADAVVKKLLTPARQAA